MITLSEYLALRLIRLGDEPADPCYRIAFVGVSEKLNGGMTEAVLFRFFDECIREHNIMSSKEGS